MLTLYLYSCSHHPEDDHVSGRNMSVTAVQITSIKLTPICV